MMSPVVVNSPVKKCETSATLLVKKTMQDIRMYKPERPIQFNGLLTNKLITSLSGPVFAEILPNLEPVVFSSGEEVYAGGANIDFCLFP